MLRQLLALSVASTITVLAHADAAPQQKARPAAVKPLMSVYKTPACGCCGKWVDYMKAQGFDVKVENLDDLTEIKRKLGVPRELSSCHTTQVGRYVLEGHVPVEPVRRLLKERPPIVGLAVPGMPWGSPGMEVAGAAPHAYNVLTFDKAGQTTVYERR